jgi:hypothetical protein
VGSDYCNCSSLGTSASVPARVRQGRPLDFNDRNVIILPLLKQTDYYPRILPGILWGQIIAIARHWEQVPLCPRGCARDVPWTSTIESNHPAPLLPTKRTACYARIPPGILWGQIIAIARHWEQVPLCPRGCARDVPWTSTIEM